MAEWVGAETSRGGKGRFLVELIFHRALKTSRRSSGRERVLQAEEQLDKDGVSCSRKRLEEVPRPREGVWPVSLGSCGLCSRISFRASTA